MSSRLECDWICGHVGSVQISLSMPGLHGSELIAFQKKKKKVSVERAGLFVLPDGIK